MQTFDLCTYIFTKVLKGNRTNSSYHKFSTIYVHALAFLGLQNIGKFILILLEINKDFFYTVMMLNGLIVLLRLFGVKNTNLSNMGKMPQLLRSKILLNFMTLKASCPLFWVSCIFLMIWCLLENSFLYKICVRWLIYLCTS